VAAIFVPRECVMGTANTSAAAPPPPPRSHPCSQSDAKIVLPVDFADHTTVIASLRKHQSVVRSPTPSPPLSSPLPRSREACPHCFTGLLVPLQVVDPALAKSPSGSSRHLTVATAPGVAHAVGAAAGVLGHRLHTLGRRSTSGAGVVVVQVVPVVTAVVAHEAVVLLQVVEVAAPGVGQGTATLLWTTSLPAPGPG
jgi:hypothetical protein